jgi:hypothetical protein
MSLMFQRAKSFLKTLGFFRVHKRKLPFMNITLYAFYLNVNISYLINRIAMHYSIVKSQSQNC